MKGAGTILLTVLLAAVMLSTAGAPATLVGSGGVDSSAQERAGPGDGPAKGDGTASGGSPAAYRVPTASDSDSRGGRATPRSPGLYDGLVNYTDVLLVVNNNSQMSRDIGAYFAQKRGIEYPNFVNVTAPTSETISRAQFEDLRSQIEDHITGHGLEDQLSYIVTTKGVPLRVSGGSTTYACVDSELTMILGPYSSNIGNTGWFLNTYGGADERFDREVFGIYLVTRLTGYFYDGIISMIDNTSASLGSRGGFVFDVDPGKDGSSGYKVANDWMRNANATLYPRGHDVFLDETITYVTNQDDVFGYSSWGSNDGHDTDHAKPHNTWVNGSISETFVSTGGRTFNWGPASYPPYSGQSLVADWLLEGSNAVKGYVYEPYLSACAHTDILFDRYTRGYTMAESYYMASAMIGWQDVVVGDPKMAPFMDILPDLVIEDIDVTCGPALVNENDEVTINVTVHNTGVTDVSGCDVKVYLGHPNQGGEVLKNFKDTPVAGDGSVTLGLEWNTSEEAGTKEVYAKVILPVDAIELRPDNNMGSSSFTINQRPYCLLDSVEPKEAARGATVDIHVKVSDAEQANDTLDLRGRYAQAGDEWTDLPAGVYDAADDLFVVSLPTDADFALGWYDLELRVDDDNGGTHGWRQWGNAFRLDNVEPSDVWVEVLTPEVWRGMVAQVLVTGGDYETSQTALVAQAQYLPPGGAWTDFSAVAYSPGDAGWLATFEIPLTATLGAYDVQARLKDGESGQQYYGWVQNYGNLTVLNNNPVVTEVTLFAQDVPRSETIMGAVGVEDVEDAFSYLRADVQMMLSKVSGASSPGVEWRSADDVYQEDGKLSFEIPTELIDTAGYSDIRARAVDRDESDSGWTYLNGTLHLSNNPPVIEDLGVSPPRLLRGGTVLLSAEADDPESTPEEMTLNFHVITPGGDNVTLPGTAYQGEYSAEFPTTGDMTPGQYDVAVTLSDSSDDPAEAHTVYGTGPSFRVQNARPSISDGFAPKTVSAGSGVRMLVTGTDSDAAAGEPRLSIMVTQEGAESAAALEDLQPMDGGSPSSLADGDPDEWTDEIDDALAEGRFVWLVELEATTFPVAGKFTVSLRMTDAWGGDSGWSVNRTVTVEAAGTPSDGGDGNVTPGGGGGSGTDGPGLLGDQGGAVIIILVVIVAAVLAVVVLMMMARKKKGEGGDPQGEALTGEPLAPGPQGPVGGPGPIISPLPGDRPLPAPGTSTSPGPVPGPVRSDGAGTLPGDEALLLPKGPNA